MPAALLAGCLLGWTLLAGEPPCDPCRAYDPCPAWYARPSDTGHYLGYYVGGGAPYCGEPRRPDEGTWGWDYGGWLLPSRVVLQWFHGRRYQGGTGAYQTDKQRLLSPKKSG